MRPIIIRIKRSPEIMIIIIQDAARLSAELSDSLGLASDPGVVVGEILEKNLVDDASTGASISIIGASGGTA